VQKSASKWIFSLKSVELRVPLTDEALCSCTKKIILSHYINKYFFLFFFKFGTIHLSLSVMSGCVLNIEPHMQTHLQHAQKQSISSYATPSVCQKSWFLCTVEYPIFLMVKYQSLINTLSYISYWFNLTNHYRLINQHGIFMTDSGHSVTDICLISCTVTRSNTQQTNFVRPIMWNCHWHSSTRMFVKL